MNHNQSENNLLEEKPNPKNMASDFIPESVTGGILKMLNDKNA